jgi:hypothetical protein
MPTRPSVPAGLVDAFGEAAKAREDFAPTEALYQKLHKELKACYADAAPNAGFVETGEHWILDVSARKMERVVDVKKARKRLGAATFLKVCTVTLKALESYLLKPEIDALAVASQTGSRSFVVTSK